jgi:hypothetical protein
MVQFSGKEAAHICEQRWAFPGLAEDAARRRFSVHAASRQNGTASSEADGVFSVALAPHDPEGETSLPAWISMGCSALRRRCGRNSRAPAGNAGPDARFQFSLPFDQEDSTP